MTLSRLIKKIFFVELLQGLSITLRTMFQRAVTEQYPRQRGQLAERFRGEPRMGLDANGKTLCIACNLCAQICPENCITVVREKDPETKKFVLQGYTFDMRRCLFCGFCEEVCPTGCIQLTPSFEMAQFSLDKIILDLPTLERGLEKKVYKK